MGKNDKFNHKKAEADLDSIGVSQPDRSMNIVRINRCAAL